jgi:hypothetical protein
MKSEFVFIEVYDLMMHIASRFHKTGQIILLRRQLVLMDQEDQAQDICVLFYLIKPEAPHVKFLSMHI